MKKDKSMTKQKRQQHTGLKEKITKAAMKHNPFDYVNENVRTRFG